MSRRNSLAGGRRIPWYIRWPETVLFFVVIVVSLAYVMWAGIDVESLDA